MKWYAAATLLIAAATVAPHTAFAWGDEGHEIVGLIADHYLDPKVQKTVRAMLRADPDDLTKHDIASEATWADKYRDENNRKDHYTQTENWHFVDLELSGPDMTSACFGRPKIPSGTVASNGPAKDCVVDKIEQFSTELVSRSTGVEERRMALKFLLHVVGDLHQPLHASDNNDRIRC